MESIPAAHSLIKEPGERQMLVASDKAVEQVSHYIWAMAAPGVAGEAKRTPPIVMLGSTRPKQNEMRFEVIAGEVEQPEWTPPASATFVLQSVIQS
jgi:hypothetical protein